ncbi:glycine betaine ABC transporter substrate-binding protein [Marinivivus vitaminiproducens]|uniref:glycine betaine ABC transporter substrate-binding protein n=1 Tax=Marinivivus vitaminiproducens TaxID=3035935 RepID=UPI002798FF99|nr:glycine betaine ABC transporter substrate-binding protein [Geminicoccaceae bacterium SCSIO 64248]
MLRRTFTALAMGTALIALTAGGAQAQAEKSIKIGWTAWADAEAVTKLAQRILTEKMGYEVELVMADIGIQYQGIAQGDLDAMMMSWQPVTHASYLEQLGDQVDDLGPIYTHAKLGWAVPAYVPEDQVASIEDLAKPEVAEQLGNQIQGIDPGAGLMQASEKAVSNYGLSDYTLVSSSEAAMLAELDRAERGEEWIVATLWNPHWIFSKYDLRYLEDPKGDLGGSETVNVLARQELVQDQPEAYDFFSRFFIELSDLEAMMFEAQNTSYDEAVTKYIDEHPAQVNYWVTGEIAG